MGRTLLALAAALEIVMSCGLAASRGLERPGAFARAFVAGSGSLVLRALAARSVPMGTSYAGWTALGGAGAARLGIALSGEAATPLRMASIARVLAGVAGPAVGEGGGARRARGA